MRLFRLFLILFFCSILAQAQQSTVTSVGAVVEITNIAYKMASSTTGNVMLTSTGQMTVYFGARPFYEGKVSDLEVTGASSAEQKYNYFKGILSVGVSPSGGNSGSGIVVVDSTKSRKVVQISNFPDSTQSRKSIQVENFPDSLKSRKQIEVLNFPDSTQSRKQVQIANFPELPVFGNIPPEIVDFFGFASISVENALQIIVENVGASNATFNYGGLIYTIQSGEQRRFDSILDKTKSKYTPMASLTVDGSNATIRVIKILTQ